MITTSPLPIGGEGEVAHPVATSQDQPRPSPAGAGVMASTDRRPRSPRPGELRHFAAAFARPDWWRDPRGAGIYAATGSAERRAIRARDLARSASWVDAEQATSEQVATCSTCPVVAGCSACTESHQSDDAGVWAGRSHRERVVRR